MKNNQRGEVVTIVLICCALLGGLFLVKKPKVFDKRSKQADSSVVATANLENVTNERGSQAAASVVAISKANTLAPDSPTKDFITKEIPVALANLPAPDALALIAAESRRAAVMEGRAIEAEKLYAAALQNASTLQKERDTALAARRAIDSQLVEAAALQRGAEGERNLFIIVAVLSVALWLYCKITHFSPSAIASAISDIRKGSDPVTSLDIAASPLQQKIVDRIVKLSK